jgi:hypothetical protein
VVLDPNNTDIKISDCYFTRPISLSLHLIDKYANQNKIRIIFKNSDPYISQWASFYEASFKDII